MKIAPVSQPNPTAATGLKTAFYSGWLVFVAFALCLFWPMIAQSNIYSDDFYGDAESGAMDTSSLPLISDDNLLIVDIFLGNYRLAGDVFIYTTPEATVIPLQPLFDAVEFPINVDPVALKAHGWFLRESNRFDLNVDNRQLIVGDRIIDIDVNALLVSDEIDLYADILLLKQWLPFEVELQTGKLRLNITSTEPLPLEQQLEREKQRQRNKRIEQDNNFPVQEDVYRSLGVPTVDINLGGVARDSDDIAAAADDVDLDLSYSIQASADVLGLQGSLSLSRSSIDADTEERLTLYKRPNHPDQNMIGELGYAALGDVFSVSDALVYSGGDGLGVDLQFGGVERASDFDKRIIEGEATPNWEVELYRNGALIDFQVVGEDARYRFEDVPVEYGENIFDIRLFGPQGQEQSKRESITVGEQSLPKGELYARASYVNVDKRVFDDDDSGRSTATAGSTDIVVDDEIKSRFFVQAGVTEWLSAGIAFSEHKASPNTISQSTTTAAATTQSPLQDYQYVEASITGALPFAAVALSHASLLDGGTASLFSLQTQLGDTSLSLSHKHYDDFTSDRNSDGRLEDDLEIRLTGTLSPFNLNPVSYQLIGNYESNHDGSYDYTIDNRLGFQLFNGRLTLDNEYREGSFADQSVNGSARYLRAIGSRTNIRASLDYGIDPKFQATGASSSITWRPNRRMRTQLGVNADFTDNDNNNLSLSMSYIFKGFTLSTNSYLQEGGGASFLLNAEFSLGRENKRRWRASNQLQANYGRIKARAFLDHDQNGKFSANDEPLAGIRLAGRKGWDEKETLEDGIVYLSGLRYDFPTQVKIDEGSLADPYWRSSFDAAAIVSHPGGLKEIDIPISLTVEAEGSVSIMKSLGPAPLAGLPITILNADGEKVAEAVTEFDGYYVVEGLMGGDYRLDIDPLALERLNVNHFQAIEFSADADEGVVYIDPIVLYPGDRAPETGMGSETEMDTLEVAQTAAVKPADTDTDKTAMAEHEVSAQEVTDIHASKVEVRDETQGVGTETISIKDAVAIEQESLNNEQRLQQHSSAPEAAVRDADARTHNVHTMDVHTRDTQTNIDTLPKAIPDKETVTTDKKLANNTEESKDSKTEQRADTWFWPVIALLSGLILTVLLCRFFYRQITGKG